MRPRPIVLALIVVACGYGVAVGQVDPKDALPLDTQRWSERKYGVSLQPPLGAHLLRQTADDHLVRIIDGEKRFQITVAVRRSSRRLTLKEVTESIKGQMINAQTDTRFIAEYPRKYAEKPAALTYYRGRALGKGASSYGQAIVMVDAQTYAILEVSGSIEHERMLFATFEATLGTLEIADQQKLAEMRKAAIMRGEKWRKTVRPETERRALVRDQYFRIVHDKKDIGWMHVNQSPGNFNAQQGIKVTVHTHLDIELGTIKSVADYFRPNNRALGEAWSVRTSIYKPGVKAPFSTLETGTATPTKLVVTIEGMEGVGTKEHRFVRPDTGYLAQVENWLLPALLPHDTPAEYGFYWYNSHAQKLELRTDRVTPTLDGFVIHTRLSPNDAELVARYDTHGRLIEKDMGGGRKLLRTDPNTLRTLWNLR